MEYCDDHVWLLQHTAAPWPSLPMSATADRVACMVWLRHILHANCAASVWHSWTVVVDSVPLWRSSYTFHQCVVSHWQPCFRSLCSSHLEWSAIWHHQVTIIDRLQMTAQDTALQQLIWSLAVWLLFLTCMTLSLVLFLSVVKYLWSFLDSMAL